MSRRRKDQETKKDWKFQVPDFDEDDYIRKETISFRTTVILFIYSVFTAAISWAVWLPLHGNPTGAWLAALAVGGVLGYLLRYIYGYLKVDVEHFGRKEWTGTGFLYFFSWLAFFLFLTNPPIYDGVAPVIEVHVSPDLQSPGEPVVISVVTYDNVGIAADSLEFRVTGPGGETIATQADTEEVGYDIDGWQWEGALDTPGTYDVRVAITDTNGRETIRESSFTIDPDPIDVAISGAGTISTKKDVITAEVPAEVDTWRVTLRLLPDDPTMPVTDVLMTREETPDRATGRAAFWSTTSAAPGFLAHHNKTENLTMRFQVVVEEHDAYLLTERYGIDTQAGVLVTDTTYQVTFNDANLLSADVEVGEPGRRPSDPQQTPGPGMVVLLAVLVAVVAVARKRRS